ncbi:MAG: hypothetical protein SOT09_02295 [Candidatus Borkfalkiaceae bacterium]|nr:hypothetical protein [Christensenellaceae bacterium]
MKKILILLITIAFASLTMGVITGCGSNNSESTHEHKYADAYTCHDRPCTVEGCEHVEAATTEHKYGEWVTVRQPSCTEKGTKTRECEDCGDTESADIPAAHKYADEYTCHDRTCTVCGNVEKASSEHVGDWTTVKEPNCTEVGLKERTCANCNEKESVKIPTKHSFGDDGVCTSCHKDVKEFLIMLQTDAATVTARAEKGRYTISSTEAGSVYAMIPGEILTELKKLGYTTLSVIAKNPAPQLDTQESANKPIKVAADKTLNLWNEDTAIAFYGWEEFLYAGKKINFEIDLNEYAGRDIYIYTERANEYPLEIMITEFGYEDKSEWLFASAADNGEVTYIEDKGWVIKNAGTGVAWYCQISSKIMKQYIDQGYTRMVITYVNNLEGEANTDEGSFVYSHSRFIPLNAAGGADWMYQNAHTHPINALPEGNGGYIFTVDLTDTTHNFTKDVYFFFENHDDDDKTVTRGYIADIVFEKGEPEEKPEEKEDKSGWIIGNSENGYWSSVEYIKGKGWIMKDVTNGGAQGQYWLTLSTEVIQKKISEGYTKMTIVYANSLDGVDNPNEGNFINTGAKIAPTLKGGTYTTEYVKGNINQYGTEVEKDGVKYYEHRIDLTDATVDFTQVAYIICFNQDADGKKVTSGYIADIVFEKDEPEVKEDKSTWMLGSASENGAVQYIEGKGWVMSSVNGSGEFWCLISGAVIQKKIAEGYTKMTIVYANSLEGVENPNEGNFVNTASRLYPTKADDGSYISDYVSGAISSYCVINKDGNYEHAVDLTDERIDFTKNQYVDGIPTDSDGKAVTHGYIVDIVFSK